MPLDPQIAGLLQFIADAGYPPMHEGDPDTARKGFRALTVDMVSPEQVIAVGDVRDLDVPGGDGPRPARLYRPEGKGPWPTTVFLHGGGFVIGDLDTHDQTCRRLCRDADTVVLSVDYRLAPEHPFPAGLEDALAATRWALEHTDDLGGTDRVGIGGDSAGGNLSAVVAQHVPGLAAQLLYYPATDAFTDRPSRQENAEGYFLELATMEWFFAHYVGDGAGEVAPEDPRISPILREDLAGQPPAVVATAGFDPLRDEGEAYADKLAEAGVRVEKVRFDELIHGFVDMTLMSPGADAAVAEVTARYRALLHG
ncbi:alpha/beta hydrolase [Nocardioides sp. HDW12B]|uniref:alpha/beta hydrolase n=1 Tax=Nocardioides sp. HDW12B TaxID=2714939 RepID=UPI00140CBD10|nr:alpha/beta hydrolase [Nocardioides sp. HDW12B]QIK65229.1 alpha/beta hydrolase [Nocardioides sp. HDW12B]